MKTCTNCILPETYPGISFDEHGVCNFCRAYQPYHKNLGKEKLFEVLNSKKSSSKFDCIVPLSGGKDSTFILYYIVRELGLNPLVISYNSGFQKTIAEKNVKNACDKLGLELVVVKSPGKIQEQRLRLSYLLSKRDGGNWGTCGNCEAIIRMISINAAIKRKVPFIIWGSSAVESMDVHKYVAYNTGKIRKNAKGNRVDRIFNILKILIKDPLRVYYRIAYNVTTILQRLVLKFPLKYALSTTKIPPINTEDPKFILFFDYVQWDSINSVNILKEELGWDHPDGIDSRFDCSLHCVVNHNKLKNFGITQDGINFSNFIREGKMNKKEALARERIVIESIDYEYEELLRKLHLS